MIGPVQCLSGVCFSEKNMYLFTRHGHKVRETEDIYKLEDLATRLILLATFLVCWHLGKEEIEIHPLVKQQESLFLIFSMLCFLIRARTIHFAVKMRPEIQHWYVLLWQEYDH